jgi:hypothetical protein
MLFNIAIFNIAGSILVLFEKKGKKTHIYV